MIYILNVINESKIKFFKFLCRHSTPRCKIELDDTLLITISEGELVFSKPAPVDWAIRNEFIILVDLTIWHSISTTHTVTHPQHLWY